jgi:anti-sigma factor RsiW
VNRIRPRAPTCDTVRQAISASLDGESPGLRTRRRRAHLRRCQECRLFEAGVEALAAPMFLDGSRRVPDDLQETLVRALAGRADPPPAAARARLGAPRVGWRRSVQWAGALGPALALVVLLPLGAFSAASGRPTHASTPCTVNLRHAPRP